MKREREDEWEDQSRNEGGGGRAVCCLRGTCPQGLATPWDREPFLLSHSFPVLPWVLLSDSLPEK